MPAPKEQGRNPLKKGVKFVKKANCWVYYEIFNKENVPDKMEWFNNENDAMKRFNLPCIP